MTRSRLWFPLVAPAAAFGIEGAAGWWIGNLLCGRVPAATARAGVIVLTLAMVAIAAAALAAGVVNYRQATAASDVAGDRVAFMALGGVFVSASFMVGLVWFGMTGALLEACGGMR